MTTTAASLRSRMLPAALLVALLDAGFAFVRPTPFGTPMWWYILLGHPVVVGLPIVSLVREECAA